MNESFIDKGGGYMGKVHMPKEYSMEYLSQRLPGAWALVDHPIHVDGLKWPLYQVIILLNDVYKWTREEIADWVEGLQDKGEIDASFKDDPYTQI
jgi:hypothetical protein